MGGSSEGLINGPLVFGDLSSLEPELFYGIQASGTEHLTLDDIELAAAAGLLRIYIVSFPAAAKAPLL